jgi:hypothetical protein
LNLCLSLSISAVQFQILLCSLIVQNLSISLYAVPVCVSVSVSVSAAQFQILLCLDKLLNLSVWVSAVSVSVSAVQFQIISKPLYFSFYNLALVFAHQFQITYCSAYKAILFQFLLFVGLICPLLVIAAVLC